MGRVLLFSALFAIGCASSSHELREAESHQARADEAAARRDYHKAAHEQDKAAAHRQEAYDRERLGM
jgi:hypothetical protein